MIFSFITLKLNVDHFGTELFGMWIVFASLWGLGSSIDFGFGVAIIKNIAEAKRDEDNEKINSLLATGFLVFVIFGLILVLAGVLAGTYIYFTNTNIVPPKFFGLGVKIFAVLAINFYLRYIWIFLKSILEGFNNFVTTSILSISGNLFILISVIIITFFKLNLISLAYCYLISSVFLITSWFYVFKKRYNKYKINLKYYKFPLIKGMLKFSFSVQISTICIALIDPLTKYIISNYSTLNLVPLYEIGRRFALAFSGLFSSTFRTILPKASILRNTDDLGEHFRNEIVKVIKLGNTYSGVVYGIFILLISLIISYWFKLDMAIILFLILATPESINNFGYPTYMFILGIGRASFLASLQLLNLMTVTVCLILGFVLLKNIAALYGYSISVMVGNSLMLFFVFKHFKISIKKFLLDTKIYKLLVLNASLILSVVYLLVFNKHIFLISSGISLISFILYFNDAKASAGYIYNSLIRRKSSIIQ